MMHWSQLPTAEETKKKIRVARALQIMSPRSEAFKKMLSDRMLGNKHSTGKKSEAHKRKISEAHKRIGSPWLVGKKRKPFSEQHKLNISLSHRGEKSPSWKGGISVINEGVRRSLEYKQWRKKVLKRDGYACVLGGKAHGSKLNADHVKRFADYPELRLEVSNGRTLCEDCHKKTPTYGRIDRTLL